MSIHEVQRIGILVAEQARAESLVTLVREAGLVPCRVRGPRAQADAFLVHWTPGMNLGAWSAPVIALVDPLVRGRQKELQGAARVFEWAEDSDPKRLLAWRSSLVSALNQLVGVRPPARSASLVALPPTELAKPAPQCVAIGVSTGGPEALSMLCQSIAGYALPPLVIVQHIPMRFLVQLAERLSNEAGYPAKVAGEGTRLTPGTAWFAPTDSHLRIAEKRDGALVARLTDEPPVRGHRPAAEILFESCAALKMRGLGVMMTGMGRDGARALLTLREQGWATLGQDEASCAVYGMPKEAFQIGAIERQAPLKDLGRWILMLCRARPLAGVH